MRTNQKLTIRSLVKNQSGMLWLALLLGLISTLSAVFLLAISGWFITAAGLAGVMGITISFNYFLPGALIRLMAILRTSGRYFEQLTAHHHLLSLLKQLRLWIWQQLIGHPFVQHLKIGSLLQRIVNDVDLINSWPLKVWMPRIYAYLSCIAYLIVIYFCAPITLIPMMSGLIINAIILPWLSYRIGRKLVWRLQMIGVYRRTRFINLFGALVTLLIRGRWQNYAQRLFNLDEKQFANEYRMQLIAAGTRHMMLAIIALTIMSSSLLAMNSLESGQINGSVFAGLLFALLGLNEVLSNLATAFIGTAQAQVGIKRLNQLQPLESITPPDVNTPSEPLKQVHLEQASIRKAGAVNGLEDMTFTIEPGSKIWLKGPSGIGKSTLLDALANQLNPDQGQITYNKTAISLEKRFSYQAQIGYLSQTPYIFNQTLANNLRLGQPGASDDDLLDVLEAVALDNWVKSLPKGIYTLLGAQGNDISGGQARRLALARVLLQRPTLMLLDEPFEGLDKQTIEIVSQALRETYAPAMLVIASHLETPMLNTFTVMELAVSSEVE